MLPEQWSHVVSASVSPVVVISASALLCLALYNRLAAIVNRLRAVQRERLELQGRLDALPASDLQCAPGHNSLRILQGLADQTRSIRRRARLIRDALLLLLSGIGSLVICSLLAGAMVFWPEVTQGAAATFALGLILVFAGVLCAAIELLGALAPAELETELVSSLTAGRAPAADGGEVVPHEESADGQGKAWLRD